MATALSTRAVCTISNAWGIEVGERVEILGSYKSGEEYGEGRFWDVATFRVRQESGRVSVLPQRWFQVVEG